MKRLILLLTILLALAALCASPASATGTVTDTLTVKVGYWGMDTDAYVTVGSYHWSELEANLPLYYAAYSFYRAGTDGDYVTVIDSAYGFSIADLISYAGIYAGDVQSLQFYTQDQTVGYFTSFTYGELFGTTRYYFEDLAAHIHPVCDEEGNLVSWDADEAWNYCSVVQPMLALEDNWAQYEIGTEHTAPDFSSLGTGNRFRLLFGQSYPTETRTNQTAKYTHTVYVTLSGAPTLGELPPLDGTIGAHSVTAAVTVGNDALAQALASILNITSSDDSVLRITNVTVTPDPDYSDLVTVEIEYEILKEGEAYLSAAVGSQVFASTQPVSVKPNEPEPTQPKPTDEQSTQAPVEPTAAQSEAPDAAPPAVSEQTKEDKGEPVQRLAAQAIVLDAATAAKLQAPPEQQPQEGVTRLTLPEPEPSALGAYTALGAAILVLLGALGSLLYYKKER